MEWQRISPEVIVKGLRSAVYPLQWWDWWWCVLESSEAVKLCIHLLCYCVMLTPCCDCGWGSWPCNVSEVGYVIMLEAYLVQCEYLAIPLKRWYGYGLSKCGCATWHIDHSVLHSLSFHSSCFCHEELYKSVVLCDFLRVFVIVFYKWSGLRKES
jgi:hypothetical protein